MVVTVTKEDNVISNINAHHLGENQCHAVIKSGRADTSQRKVTSFIK